MNKIVALAAVAALFASTSIAGAVGLAEITSSSGKVLVNQGAGFVPVAGMMSLNAGDLVMVGEGAQAQISFATGCTVTAGSASVTTISDVAPCQAGEDIGSVGLYSLANCCPSSCCIFAIDVRWWLSSAAVY